MNVMRDPNGSDEERYKAIGITGKFEVDGRPAQSGGSDGIAGQARGGWRRW